MSTLGNPNIPTESNVSFSRLGERVCLDFVNTKEHRLYRSPDERLHSYSALLDWAVYFNVMSEDERRFLWERQQEAPEKGSAVLEKVTAFREVLHRVFSAIAHGDVPSAEDLDQIKQMYVQALAHTNLTFVANSFDLAQDEQNLTEERILWAVARSAIEVLTTADLGRIKECPGLDDCGYLFLDVSKNGTRHWCSMDNCGSRAKMRRQYARKRGKPDHDAAQ